MLWDAQNPGNKKICDIVGNSLILMKEYGPYGPQGPWAQPLFDCVAVPSGGFSSAKKASKKKQCVLLGT